MARTIKCFVSFLAKRSEEQHVEFLVDVLKKRLGDKVEFLLYTSLSSGQDFQKFMASLRTAEAAIVLFSSEYTRRVENREADKAVYQEYNDIVARLEGHLSPDVPMTFIPVYWQGDELPVNIHNHLRARDLRQFRVHHSNGQYFLPSVNETIVRQEIDKIVEELDDRWKRADPLYDEYEQDIGRTMLASASVESEPTSVLSTIDTALFVKAERTDYTIEEFSTKFFVKTAAFRSIGQYHRMAFTGRKGSGKTTLLKVYKYLNAARYFEPIDVEVNDWNLHFLISDLRFRKPESDLVYTESESKIFDFIWPVFLSLCMVRSIRATLPNFSLETLIVKASHRANFLKDHERYDALFGLAVQIVAEFIDFCVKEASDAATPQFEADLMKSVNVKRCTEFVLGEGYQGLLQAVRSDEGRRRFLFCFDRFDTEIQKYRRESSYSNIDDEQRLRRENREVSWIQGLVEMIDHLRRPDNLSLNQEFYQALGPLVDFCVPLPKDRLVEVQRRRRDAIVGQINDEINWRPLELLTMLRKRMQEVWRVNESEIDKVELRGARKRYERVLELSGRSFPATVNISLKETQIPHDLFLNVLRHSFFRPRDVNIYYTPILTTIEVARIRRTTVSAETIKHIISSETRRVVQDEFINEFKETFQNLTSMLDRFRGSPQLLSKKEVEERIGDMPFEMYSGESVTALGEKMKFLYEIGFIGISSAVGRIGGVAHDDYDFYFLNSQASANIPGIIDNLKFAIHPVFIEYLALQLNAQVPVMNLTWEKIDAHDDHV